MNKTLKFYSQMSNNELLAEIRGKMENGGLNMDDIDACLWFESKLEDGEKLTLNELEQFIRM